MEKKNILRLINLFENYEKEMNICAVPVSYIYNNLINEFTDDEINQLLKTDLFVPLNKKRYVLLSSLFDTFEKIFKEKNYQTLSIITIPKSCDITLIKKYFYNLPIGQDFYNFLMISDINNKLSYINFLILKNELIDNIKIKYDINILDNYKVDIFDNAYYATKDLDEIFKGKMNKRTYNVVESRVKGKTLEELSLTYNLSKERIRIIEKTVEEKLLKWIDNNDLFFKYLYKNKPIMTLNEFCKLLKEESLVNIIVSIIYKYDKDTNLQYIPELKLISYNYKHKITKALSQMISYLQNNEYQDICTIENANKYLSDLTDGVLDEKYNYCKMYLDYYNLEIRLNFLTEKGITLGEAIIIVSNRFYPKGIKYSDLNVLSEVSETLNNNFGFKTKPNRALAVRIQEVLIMCNKSTYCDIKQIKMPYNLLQEIKDYILNNDIKEEISYPNLFNVFKDRLLENSNIDNHHFLHGVMKYIQEKYNFKYYCSKSGISRIE